MAPMTTARRAQIERRRKVLTLKKILFKAIKKALKPFLHPRKPPAIFIADKDNLIVIESKNEDNLCLFKTPLLEKYQEEDIALYEETQQMLKWCCNGETSAQQKKQILKSGTSKYKMPVPSSDLNSNKLVPSPLQRQTKSN
ncbi:hypothetical protein PTTG_27387 [Puccinia triticina 1-1 BBBD Race 1]|uniref:Uncharacterized protein n=1 Tax=Puccinia triticina (isolate 1-1 / race 1 (BBBD)) TaxID=630390 RepID=A0A180GMP9_PUCT1|nr:hypothetical protein PTTG_27387 [Puccinia triticina 1-1 BBBD Race 1]